MINSFKSRITKTIQTLQSHRAQILESLKEKPFEELAQSLATYCDSKSIKTLMSVLESDFDLKDQTIASLFEKIDKIGQELTKQNPQQTQPQPKNHELLAMARNSVDISMPLQEGDNEFLKETQQYSPQTIQHQTPKRTKILRRMHIKQKLKTDSSYRIEPQLGPYQRTMTKEDQYFSEQKIRDEVSYQGGENHWEEIFKIYHKLPLGILKENSFEERSLSYKTVNYQKILAFLTELGLSINADGRLQIIKIMRRFSLNHKFVTKSEFKDVYNELCRYFRVSQKDVNALIQQKQVDKPINEVNLSRKRGISVDKSADAITKRSQIPKNKAKKAISFLPDERYKIERTYTSNAIDKLKSKQLTWEVLFNMSDPSVLTNIPVPPLDLNRANEDQDSYYLQQFYNRKVDKSTTSPTKAPGSITTKGKIMLPLIRGRQGVSKQSHIQQI